MGWGVVHGARKNSVPITESEAVAAINIQLMALGWRLDPREAGRNVFQQQARTQEQQRKLAGGKPDYVLYAHDDSDAPTLVMEAKRPGQSISAALQQSIDKYAQKIGAPIAVATDGWRVKTWHIPSNAPLFIDGREVEELFDPKMARHFSRHNNFTSFLQESTLDKGDLITKFKKANDILYHENIPAGWERFSEFANLMFLKLQLEAGREIAGFSWPDIQNRRGTNLLKAVQLMIKELGREHDSTLFESSRIKNPKNMERLIEMLSSFRLSSVKDDIKGLAFEHFIHSYTRGAKNDLGQFFTPRHIVRMMVYFLKPEIGETIYDPFCGTGGMLIETFRYINQRIKEPCDKLFLKQSTLFGRDGASAARIAMMNMIMFGDGHTNIQQGDSYASLDQTKNKYDIVITNIPFSQKTDFIEGYPVLPTGSKNGDSIGVQHCLESLKQKDTARAAIIVPISFLYKSELTAERQHIFKNWNLNRVVELSPKCFQPYTEQQTAILFIGRNQTDAPHFPYYRVKNDGYSQDGYRIPLSGENDIDKVMDDKGMLANPVDATPPAPFKRLHLLRTDKSGDRRTLGDVAKITAGSGRISPKTNLVDIQGGIHPIFMVADLAKRHTDYHLTESQYRITDHAVQEKKPHLFAANTILLPVTGKASLKNHRALLAEPAYATSTLAGIEANEARIHPFCLFHFLLNFDMERITYDLGYPGISTAILAQIPVPNYTSAQQQDIINSVTQCITLEKQLKSLHTRLTTPNP